MASIVAYGSGEILHQVFNAIAILMNGGNGALFKPIMMVAAVIGGFWVITKAFFDHSIDGLFTKWFLPFVVFYGAFLVPTEVVSIIDPVAAPGKMWKVNNVPLLLARSSQTFSTIGYTLTKAIEQVFSLPDNIQYNKTGYIFGAENLMEMSHYVITDENLATNMRSFVQQCVTYDILLGRYSMEELKNSNNIWNFVRNGTSNVRMFPYCRAGNRGKCELISCKVGAQELNTPLKNQTNMFARHAVLGHLPFTFQGLTSVQKDGQELIAQQIMMHTIVDAIERKCDGLGLSSNFAVRRAYMQQRQTFEVAGVLAAKSLVVLRNIIEALIYASFIFIMPLILMPSGIRSFLNWLGLAVWIQLWPPFYAILNYIMTICAQMRSQKMFGTQIDLSFVTSTGLINISYDMQAIAGYLSLSIPFISYAVLRGGIASFTQLSTSVMSSVQSASSAAASEQLSGNYSFGNLQYETQNAYSQNMLSHNSAPSMTTGFYKEDTGTSQYTYSNSTMVMNEQVSQLPFEMQSNKMIAASMRRQAQDMMSLSDYHKSQAGKSFNSSMRHLSEFTQHVASNNAYDTSITEHEGQSMQSIAQDTVRKTDAWSEKEGLDQQVGFDIIASIGAGMKIPFIKANLDVKGYTGAKRTEIIESAKNYAEETALTKNFQAMSSFAKDSKHSAHDDTGRRLAESTQTAYDDGQSHVAQSERAIQKSDNYSKLADYADSQSLSMNRRYNQEFVDWLASDQGSYAQARHIIQHKPEVLEVAQENFMKIKERQMLDNVGRYDLSTESGYAQAKASLGERYVPIEKGASYHADDDIGSSIRRDNNHDDNWNNTNPTPQKPGIVPQFTEVSKFSEVEKQTSADLEQTKEALAQKYEQADKTVKKNSTLTKKPTPLKPPTAN